MQWLALMQTRSLIMNLQGFSTRVSAGKIFRILSKSKSICYLFKVQYSISLYTYKGTIKKLSVNISLRL